MPHGPPREPPARVRWSRRREMSPRVSVMAPANTSSVEMLAPRPRVGQTATVSVTVVTRALYA